MKGDLQHRENWGTLAFAFVVWAGHFVAIYAAALIFPGQAGVVRLIVVVATLAAAALLGGRWYRLGSARRSTLAKLSLAIAGMAVAFQTAPGILG